MDQEQLNRYIRRRQQQNADNSNYKQGDPFDMEG